jgi:hypothetical protein
MFGGQDLRITASAGVAIFPNDGDDCETLLRNSMAAMHESNSRCHGRLRFHSGNAALDAATAFFTAAESRNCFGGTKALTDMLGLEDAGDGTIDVPIGRVSINMIVAEDLRTRTGVLLVPKGYRVSERLVARLGNFNQELLTTVIRVRKMRGLTSHSAAPPA